MVDEERDNRKRRSGFGRGLLIYLILLLLIFGGLLGVLWKKLSDYQQSVDARNLEKSARQEEAASEAEEDPLKAPQECFLKYMDGLTEDDWVDLYYEKQGERLDSEDAVRSFLQDRILTPGYQCFRGADYTAEQPVYMVMNGEEPLLQVTLASENGGWSVADSRLLIGGDCKAQVSVPAGFRVLCNGTELTDEDVKEQTAFSEINDYGDQLENPVEYDCYELQNLLEAPEITVEQGEDSCLPVQGADGQYYRAMSEEDSSDYRSKAESFISALLQYYSVGKENAEANLGGVLSHVVSGSKASTVIHASLDGVMWRPADYSVSYEIETSEAYVLADNCCAVDVTYWDQKDESAKQIYRVFFLDGGSGYGIVQFASIDAAESGDETASGDETLSGNTAESGDETASGDETLSGNTAESGDETVSGNETASGDDAE